MIGKGRKIKRERKRESREGVTRLTKPARIDSDSPREKESLSGGSKEGKTEREGKTGTEKKGQKSREQGATR